jgi:hypothetical protein
VLIEFAPETTFHMSPLFNVIWLDERGKVARYVVTFPPGPNKLPPNSGRAGHNERKLHLGENSHEQKNDQCPQIN